MLRVPQVAYEPVAMPAMAAPGVQPMQSAAPQQIGQLGEGLAKFGQANIRIGDILEDEINDTMATQAINNARNQWRSAAGGTPQQGADGKTTIAQGFLTTQHQDAVVGYEGARKRINDIYEEGMKGLLNDTQKVLYAHKAGAFRDEYINRVDEHTYKQHKIFRDRELGTLAAGYFNDAAMAIAYPGDAQLAAGIKTNPALNPDALLQSGFQTVIEIFESNGIPKDSPIVKAALQEATDKTFKTATDILTHNQNWDLLGQVVTKYGQFVSPQLRESAIETVQQGEEDRNSMRYSANLQTQFPGDYIKQVEALQAEYAKQGSTMSATFYKQTLDHLAQASKLHSARIASEAAAVLDEAQESVRQAVQMSDADPTKPRVESPAQFLAMHPELRAKLAANGKLPDFEQWFNTRDFLTYDMELEQAMMARWNDGSIAQMSVAEFKLKYGTRIHKNQLASWVEMIEEKQKGATPGKIDSGVIKDAVATYFVSMPWFVAEAMEAAEDKDSDEANQWEVMRGAMYGAAEQYVREKLESQPPDVLKLGTSERLADALSGLKDLKARTVDFDGPVSGVKRRVPQAIVPGGLLQLGGYTVQLGEEAVDVSKMPPSADYQGAASAIHAKRQARQALEKQYPGAVPVVFAAQDFPIDILKRLGDDQVEGTAPKVSALVELARETLAEVQAKQKKDPTFKPPRQLQAIMGWAKGPPAWWVRLREQAEARAQAAKSGTEHTARRGL